MQRIVCIGGGHGLSNLLESFVNESDFSILAITSVMDSGGSTGEIREKFNTIALGDLRRAIGALAQNKKLKKIFEERNYIGEMPNNKLKISNAAMQKIKDKLKDSKIEHPVGNIFLLGLILDYGLDKGIQKACDIMQVNGAVLPVTLSNVDLVAKLIDGQKIIGETNIDIPKHDGNLKINKLSLTKKANLHPRASKFISESDIIIIGPGDLYTSVLCNFCIEELQEKIIHSQSKKIWINNLTNKYGETTNFTCEDYVKEIKNYIGKNVVEYFFCQENTKLPDRKDNIKFVKDDFVTEKNGVKVHNGRIIIDYIRKLT